MSWVNPALSIEEIVMAGALSEESKVQVDHSPGHKCIPFFLHPVSIARLNFSIFVDKTNRKLRKPELSGFVPKIFKGRFEDPLFPFGQY
jgi:hypothetical protein